MKIGIVGTRGIPAKYGGFETFAQEISPLLVERGFEVTVYCDKSDIHSPMKCFKNVALYYLPVHKSKKPLIYYFLSLWNSLNREEIILVTGTGGAFFYFLNIWKHKIIITNTDGIESKRAKWSYLIRQIGKLSEFFAIYFSDHIIADSEGIRQYIITNYTFLKTNKLSVIEYGAIINHTLDSDCLTKHKLEKNNYYLVVSRLEPENNLKMVVNAFKMANTNKPLIIVGNLKKNKYVNGLLQSESEKIRFIGGVYDQVELCSLRTGAFAYIHGHSVGGTNPSLLEALGSSNICICYDNIFNREVTANSQFYFKSVQELKITIEMIDHLDEESKIRIKKESRDRIENYYTWENIADKYSKLLISIKNL